MEFEIKKAKEILERTPVVLNNLLAGLSEEWTRQNEGPDTWSPYDVIGHLIHGENTDWIPRAQVILSESDDKNFVPFDRFAQFENSKGKSTNDLLAEFTSLRKSNLQVLDSMDINEDNLKKTGIHPEFGAITLKQLLSCWVAHDLGHIVQISRVMAKQYKEEVGPWTKYLKVLE